MTDWIENEIRTVEGDGFHARVIELTDARFDWVKTHAVEVAGIAGSYRVEGLPYPGSAIDLAKVLPAPNDVIDGAVLSAWTDGGGMRDDWHLIVEAPRDGVASRLETDALYRLEDLAAGTKVEDVWRPKLRMVAIDQTHGMADSVVDVIGRVKGVYTYNASVVTHLAEFSASYELEFQQNVCERAFPDAEEGEIDAVFDEAGYEDEHRFTSDDGGERFTYMHCRDIDRLESVTIETDPRFDIEFMLATEKEQRGMIEDLNSELGANSGFDGEWFKDARPVAEIVADGESRRAEREAEASPRPGM